MKQFFIVLMLSAVYTFSYGGTKTLQTSTANIMDVSVWLPAGVPVSGDTIIVPTGKQLILAFSFSFPFNVHLRVYGEVQIIGSPLAISLDPTSTIIVYGGGRISGTDSNQAIYLNGTRIFNGTTPVNGARWATVATNGFVPYVPLPVKFISFTAVRKQQSVEIRFTTTEEENADSYEIEKSADGESWSRVISMRANNVATGVNEYFFIDINNSGRAAYYRIKQIDSDGAFGYTNIRSVKNAGAVNSVSISAGANKINLAFTETANGEIKLSVFNWQGQLVQQQRVAQSTQGVVAVPFNKKGNFIVMVSSAEGVKASEKIMMH